MNVKELEQKHSVTIDYLAETTSTNDIARGEHYANKDVIIADSQTKGRGQRGNKWSSTHGKNLTFSMVLTPRFLTPDMQFYISKMVAISVIDALRHHGIESRIKWTNDIYVGDKKIAGILIENDILGTEISRSIVGIGLNVNQTEFDPLLPNPTSMSLLLGEAELDRVAIFDTLLETLYARYDNFSTTEIENEYASRIYRHGTPHTFRLPDGTQFRATIVEVKSTGELILRHSDDTLKGYLFKEVEFVI